MSHKKEMNHVVYSGWMIKSPPEKKLTGPWKIFRAKWKKRYFVLSKPAQSLPGTYHLNYYSDENLKRVRGTIDLEQCAEIIESLDSDQFQYLLAIKTTFKGKDRTYFLATDTEEQMSAWVRNLCSVCGMKPDESAEPDSPQPPVREVLPTRPAQTLQPHSTLPASAVGIMTKPPNNVNLSSSVGSRSSPSSRSRGAPERKQKPNETVTDRDSEYIPLETCTSGPSIKRPNRQLSVDSVPDEPAPPPPIKGNSEFDNDVFHPNQTYDVPPSSEQHDVYDVPPSSMLHEEEDLYKVPPARPPVHDPQEMYDIPPLSKNSPSTPRSSSSDSHKADSAYSSQGLMYDIPPIRPDGQNLDEVYDIPPSHSHNVSMDDVPPSRPPKPGHLLSSQEPYMNVPTNSRAYSDKVDINSVVSPATAGMARIDLTEMYDFPRSRSDNQGNYNNLSNIDTSDQLLTQTPPPPSKCVSRTHIYNNAKEGVVIEQDVYLTMDPVLGVGDNVPQPRESSSTDDVEYTDMAGHSSFDDSFEGRGQQLYDHPPPSRPAMPPPRPLRSTINSEKQDTYSITSSARTRSFKRKGSSPLVQRKSPQTKPKSNLAKPTQSSVPLPQRVDRHPDFSTSDEDDDEMGSADVWGTTPPAPGNKDTELKYVDLEHDDPVDNEPMRSPHGATGGITPTEYHEIDFVRTDALRNVIETVSEERSNQRIVNS